MDQHGTKLLTVDKNVENIDENRNIMLAAEQLLEGEVVAFPTETVYGLGGNALCNKAIHKIFQAKGRPSDNPLIVHIGERSQLVKYVDNIPNYATKLMDAFWPGPLTIVLTHKGNLSKGVTANLPTVAIRMPDHPIALALIRVSGIPLAAPSANTSGKPSPTKAEHVYEDLYGRIPVIVDGGPTGVGVESTVVDCTGEVPVILRPGGVTKEEMEEVVGKIEVDPALMMESAATPKSPGMKYTHYAPTAPLILVDGSERFFNEIVKEAMASGKRVGMLIFEENKGRFSPVKKEVIMGSKEDLSSVAYALYDSLRSFEEKEVDVIFSQVIPEKGLGTAIMNRLRKAAGGNIVSEA
ncbi:L-threonylcarbamoyladenylate synthase [Evansella sp. AB-P1]|uniref:L-threonylcarbamoyladenylate synthase n=1 Tax=Evansella sp. AB-P1 TaxID=3037653 RepID=UPI00241D56EB|nr:L-threonylcarbamoyladenylate synthase [Evansella sp. AB-P1]MDG5787328.1 L-threonylcarbamoyladenylate synthase [Evansella sp. AB-P1]